MQQFIVGIENSHIVVSQRRLLQQAMSKVGAVYTAADDQHLEHCRIFS
jgi:hypothetical protein